MRLFFAVELPSELQQTLWRLKPNAESRDYRWSDPSLLHVTLAFLGEQPEESVPALQHVGATAASASIPGVLRLGTAGSFGSKKAPRVLWVDLEGDVAALSSLNTKLNQGLEAQGFPVEDRPFRPHITLARRRETAHGGPPAGWPPMVRSSEFFMDTLTLMQSRLSPRGPTYTPVFHFSIGG